MGIIDKLKNTAKQENKTTPEQKSTDPQKKNTRIIAIASGKGGVGKTNIAVNLGLLLNQEEEKTLLIDADFGMANIDVVLGITPKYNLGHIIRGKCYLEDAIIAGPKELDILPGTSGADSLINMSSIAIKRLMKTSNYIEDNYSFVLIDVGAGINNDVTNFIRASDEVIVVLTPEPTSIMDAYSLIKLLKHKNYSKNINLLINQMDNQQEGKDTDRKIKNALKYYLDLEVKTLGFIPYDSKLKQAVKKQKPVVLSYPRSRATRALKETTGTILKRKKEEKSRGMKGFVYRIVGFFSD
ncbi:MAG: MinD/ParA family protein [Halanaerobiales bacterium]